MSSLNMEQTVMIVDDDLEILKLLELKIKRATAFDVIALSDPLKAIDILKERNILLVMTDINMPGMTGVELLKEIYALKKGIQVIVMTAGTTTMNSLDCFRNGATDFLVKPYQDKQIVEVVDNCLKRLNRWKEFISSRKVGASI